MRTGVSDGRVEVVEDVRGMAEGAECSQSLQQTPVLGADALEQDSDAASLEGRDHLGEVVRAGGVEQVQLRERQDHDLRVLLVGDPLDDAVRSAEEERSRDSEDGDLFVALRGLVGKLLPADVADAAEGPQREEACHGDPDQDGHDQIEAHRDDGGQQEHEGAGSTGPDHHADRGRREHPARSDHQHAGERCERDHGGGLSCQQHHQQQRQRMHDSRYPGACT